MNEEYIQEIMRNNVRVYRNKMKLRQKDMAAIMGFGSEDRISHWEKGQSLPGTINLIRMCVLFGVHPKELYPELFEKITTEMHSTVDELFRKH